MMLLVCWLLENSAELKIFVIEKIFMVKGIVKAEAADHEIRVQLKNYVMLCASHRQLTRSVGRLYANLPIFSIALATSIVVIN